MFPIIKLPMKVISLDSSMIQILMNLSLIQLYNIHYTPTDHRLDILCRFPYRQDVYLIF